MEKAYFLSDLHLKSAAEPNAKSLCDFLQSIVATNAGNEKATRLFLLGDIFDLWVGDHKYFQRKFQDIWRALESVRKAGISVHYFEGNHDIYLDRFFGEQLGFMIHREAIYLDVAGFRLRLEHGDQMDPDDTGYLFLRWFLRTRAMKLTERLLPDATIARIGERASAMSREYTSTTKTASREDIFRKIREHAKVAFSQSPFDILVAGHVHERMDEVIEINGRNVRIINLGAWFGAPVALQLDASGVKWIEAPLLC